MKQIRSAIAAFLLGCSGGAREVDSASATGTESTESELSTGWSDRIPFLSPSRIIRQIIRRVVSGHLNRLRVLQKNR